MDSHLVTSEITERAVVDYVIPEIRVLYSFLSSLPAKIISLGGVDAKISCTVSGNCDLIVQITLATKIPWVIKSTCRVLNDDKILFANAPITFQYSCSLISIPTALLSLKEETLHVQVILEAIKFVAKDPKRIMIENDNTLSDDFSKLLKSQPTDITFRIGDELISAHRLILAARSTVFNAMINAGFSESKSMEEIPIEDIKFVVFREMVNYIYSGKCDTALLSEHINDFSYAANKYELVGLKLQCEKIFSETINDENCLQILKLADTFNFPSLKIYVMEYIARYYTKICPTKKYAELCLESPKVVAELQGYIWNSKQ